MKVRREELDSLNPTNLCILLTFLHFSALRARTVSVHRCTVRMRAQTKLCWIFCRRSHGLASWYYNTTTWSSLPWENTSRSLCLR
ncbi:hypothetical protein BDU57DRAFT_520709 [Ampelomyces quisqualis]|uniref:Uncharacterized protein n=1 Tax=Ampelomyces quisqualis TaxID=50730 RepID=A0A6A5QG74_AMPQU|nr:hypothetical protein BDU57DRAFT_520709 [Ampelomyces quisqualis]